MAETGIPAGAVSLRGDLIIPPGATGMVVLADAGGPVLHSPSIRTMAGHLRAAGFATLMLDLADAYESRRRLRAQLPLLAERLHMATDWLADRADTWHMRPGYFGCGSVAGATLMAAADLGRRIGAVVLQDGRADLAGSSLPLVTAPTLMLVGEDDDEAVDLSHEAFEWLRCHRRLHVVPGIDRIADDPVAAVEATRVATDWFQHHLC